MIKKTKKKVKGAIKGSSFERDICKKLSLFISEGSNTDYFWRTAGSGARWTVRNKKGLETYGQYGDICSTHPDSKFFTDIFCIELKSYKDINIWGLITGSNNIIEDWWFKLNHNALELEKIPVLIVKQNNKPILWISDSVFKDSIESLNNIINYKLSSFIDDKEIYFYEFNDIITLDITAFNECFNMKFKKPKKN
jgi:hypothetical protein